MQFEQPLKVQASANKDRIFTAEFINIIVADLMIRICSYMQAALLPLYILEQGYSPALAGLTTSVFMLMSILSRPASGNMVDTRGRYLVMLIGSLAYCLATGFYLFAIPISLLLAIRAVQGFGFAFNGTALMTMATDIIPEQKLSEGIGYLGLTQTIAQAFASAFALALSSAYGYEFSLKLVFAVTVLNLLTRFPLKAVDKRLLGAAFKNDDKTANHNEPIQKQSGPKFRIIDKDAWKPSLIMVFVVFAASGVGTFLLAFAVQRGINNPGMFFTASALSVAAARLTVGKIHNRFGSAVVLAPGFILVIISLLLIFSATNLLLLIIAGICYGLGIGVMVPEVNTLAILAAEKENRGLANSTVFMAMDLGMAVGAVSLGIFADYNGFASIFLLCAGVVFATLLAYLFLLRTGFYGEGAV